MSKVSVKNTFIKGAISAEFIADVIAGYQTDTRIGAHDIFLGQVRSDKIEGRKVIAIDYSAYEAMAGQQFEEIKNAALGNHDLHELQIYHSIGRVNSGEICLFVIASAAHRKDVFKGLQWVVEEIKKKVPVFGKEIFEDESYQWKVNS